jgi:YfiH family protein
MAEELPLYRAPRFPDSFFHGFTTRQGGVSRGAYATLNLGAKWGDDPACVAENRRRLVRATGGTRLYSATQVHGARVFEVRPDADPSVVAAQQADALIASTSGIALTVYTADCIAVLVADPRTGAFGAAHAGWRGVVAGVVPALVRALAAAAGTHAPDLWVALGPSIGPCCFEVGPEVAARFDPAHVRAGARRADRPTVDLRAALAAQLRTLGIPHEQTSAAPPCTRCNPEQFYSYRRDGGTTGQQVGFIGRRSS